MLGAALATAACTGSKPEPPAPSPVPVIAVAVIDELQQARGETAKNEARAVLSAVQLYILTEAKCPADVDALASTGKIAKVPVDPWGHGYVVECTSGGASVVVLSMGGDGRRGTADDIVVETREF